MTLRRHYLFPRPAIPCQATAAMVSGQMPSMAWRATDTIDSLEGGNHSPMGFLNPKGCLLCNGSLLEAPPGCIAHSRVVPTRGADRAQAPGSSF